jgi:hypothetical protein
MLMTNEMCIAMALAELGIDTQALVGNGGLAIENTLARQAYSYAECVGVLYSV